LSGHPHIDEESPPGVEARKRFLEAFESTGDGHSSLFTENLRLGYRYDPSPICVPDGIRAIWRIRASSRRRGRGPGRRTRTTARCLIYSATALSCCGSARSRRARKSCLWRRARAVPLTMISMADPKVAALYERALVLVRPDGHVAWRGNRLPEDALQLIERIRGAAAQGKA
jgi:hypothetical protein